MPNKVKLNEIVIDKNRIFYDCTITGEWQRIFHMDRDFFVEYSEDMTQCPPSIAVLPFMGTMLVLSWLFDAEIILNQLDCDFYDAIEDMKREYVEMYPKFTFLGELTVAQIVKTNKPKQQHGNTVLLYSGGVDANYSLYTNMEDKPALLSVWGADVKFEDEAGWNLVAAHTRQVAKQHDLPCCLVKSSFRRFVNYGVVSKLLKRPSFLNYWYTFHHGMGLVSHAAPYAFLHGIRYVMISASYCFKELHRSFCASDPALDCAIRFCGCKVIHEGYEVARITKIRRLCTYSKRMETPMNFRVCWVTGTGKNCCICMKCSRTWLNILTEGFDPEDFGFSVTSETVMQVIGTITNEENYSKIAKNDFWKDCYLRLKEYLESEQQHAWKPDYYELLHDLMKELPFAKSPAVAAKKETTNQAKPIPLSNPPVKVLTAQDGDTVPNSEKSRNFAARAKKFLRGGSTNSPQNKD